MAIIVPILGRRTVVERLTFGCCGKLHSQGWLLTGPATIALHLGSNAINAYLVSATPGFRHVNRGQLMFLWTTRPRLTWLIVVLAPWRADEAIYISVSASMLVAELILQLTSFYFMAKATNYARIQKFFKIGRLSHTPHGHDARLMYAGALMWLIVIVGALWICISGISKIVKELFDLGRVIGPVAVIARRKVRQCRRHRTQTSFSGIGSSWEETEQETLHLLTEEWERLLKYVKEGTKDFRREMSDYRSAQPDRELEEIYLRRRRFEEQRKAKGQELSPYPRYLDRQRARRTVQTAEELSTGVPRPDWSALPKQRRSIVAAWLDQIVRLKDRQESNRRAQTQAQATKRSALSIKDSHQTPSRDAAQAREYQEQEAILSDCMFLRDQAREILHCWTQLAEERESKQQDRALERGFRLGTFAAVTCIGMFACWVAQWIWWVGFVRTMGDAYCPPKLTELGIVWGAFGAFGALVGASF